MNKLKRWELALIIGIVSAVFAGFMTLGRDISTEQKLLRLHVVGASDSEEDQELKLKVRDAVLEVCEPLLASSASVGQSKELLVSNSGRIREEAERVVYENGFDYPATVEIRKEVFDTREYEGFALPAGEYETLRITLGAGEGRNWWCVVFPPLCAEAAVENLEESALAAGLNEEDIALITRDSDQYVLRFKCVEWFGEVRKFFSK